MAAYQKFNDYTYQLNVAAHNWATHSYYAAFSNTAPVATNTILSDITQISAGGGYVTGGVQLDSLVLTDTSGTTKLALANELFTATGAVAPFRYIAVYNFTQTSPLKPLVFWADYGVSIALGTGDTFLIQFDGTNGLWQLT